MSATIQNAYIAKEEFPDGKISIIDSYNLSTGIGLLVMKACDFKNQGMDIDDISQNIRQLIPKVRSSFIIDTLEYLHLGGRLSAIQSLFGSALKIKPIIKVVDGEMKVAQKARGSKNKVIDYMLKDVLKNAANIDPSRIFITHSQGGESVSYLKEQLSINTNIDNILITDAGCVISSHCGGNRWNIIYRK